jgi:hypothetical protein
LVIEAMQALFEYTPVDGFDGNILGFGQANRIGQRAGGLGACGDK